MKNIIKLISTHFFIITVCVLIVTGLSYIIDGETSIPLYYPFEVIAIGLSTALASAIFCFKKEPTIKQILKRIPFHFVCIEFIVLSAGYLIGWYDNFLSSIPIFISVIVVYVIVCIVTIVSFKKATNSANSINEALKKYNADEENT